MKHTILYVIFAFLAGCEFENGHVDSAPAVNDTAYAVLESVQIGKRTAHFYVGFGADSAALGFSIENDLGRQRYCPMYGSTYRGIPSVTLDVFIADSQNEMWVDSSWSRYEILAYHRLGTDQCITQYGETAFFDKPTPANLAGGTKHFPEMDIENVHKAATFKYDRKSLDGAKVQ